MLYPFIVNIFIMRKYAANELRGCQKLLVDIYSGFISFDIPSDPRTHTDIEQASYREQCKSHCFVNFHRHCEQTTISFKTGVVDFRKKILILLLKLYFSQ